MSVSIQYVVDYREVYNPMGSAGDCDCCGKVTYNFEVMFGACVSDTLVVCAECNGSKCAPTTHYKDALIESRGVNDYQ